MKKTFLLGVFLLMGQFAHADIILLKSGEIIEGKVIQVRGLFIRVDSQNKTPFKEFLIENVANIEITSPDQVSQLAVRNIHNRALNKAREFRLQEVVDKKARNLLIEKGFSRTHGARPLRRTLQTEIEDILSSNLLEGKIKEGSTVSLTADTKKIKIKN